MSLAVSDNDVPVSYTIYMQDIVIGGQGIFDKISQIKCAVITANNSARDLQSMDLLKIGGKWKAKTGIEISTDVTLTIQLYRSFPLISFRHREPLPDVTQLQGADIHRRLRLALQALPNSKKKGRHDVPWTVDLVGRGRKMLSITIGLDVAINLSTRASHLLSENHENELLDWLRNQNQPPSGLRLSDHTLQKGTRKEQLQKIWEWIVRDRPETGSNVLLLVGALGTGKTCIVSKVWTELKKDQLPSRRSVLLCLTDDHVENQERVSSDLALAIADAYPAFRTTLCRILDSSFIPTRSDIPEVLAKILRAFGSIPLEERTPLVVIVDAPANFYDPMNPNIVDSWAELPSCFKLLLTARPHEGTSQAVAERKAEYLELRSGADRSDNDDSDITIFLEDKLSQFAPRRHTSMADPWPGEHIISKLVQDSAGLFSWAHAIVSSIGATRDQDRDAQLAKVVLDSTSAKYCDKSFEKILDSIFPYGFGDVHRIVGAIAISKGSLPSPILKSLLASNSQLSLKESLQKLLPIVHLNNDASIIDLRHPSFSSYITDQSGKRCKPTFAINRMQSNRDLAQVCLRILHDQLKFNICALESSYKTVDKTSIITPELAYASQFWAEHIQSASTQALTDDFGTDFATNHAPDRRARDDESRTDERDATFRDQQDGTELFELIKTFFTDTRWLYWLEVMSALGRTDDTPRLLSIVTEWLEYNGNKELSELAADASLFVSTFRDAIAFSPAHVYTSALHLCPPLFRLRGRFQPNLHNHRSIASYIDASHILEWSPWQLSFLASDSSLQSDETIRVNAGLALSADGRRVAAKVVHVHPKSRVSTVHVFSIKTGASLTTLPDGDENKVLALAFSKDRLITGSMDGGIRIWDSNTGTQLGETFPAHTDWIRGIAISPDGTQLASCSDDTTIRIVNIKNITMMSDIAPLRGHYAYVRSVTWTPSGDYIVSGGDDGTVRVWNKSTGLPFGNPMAAHRGYVQVVAVAKSGKYIASAGESDESIRLWSLDTQTQIRSFPSYRAGTEPLALTFSNDSERLFSGSDDGRFTTWDVSTGQVTADYAGAHSGSINSLCLVSNSRMVSGGYGDGLIKVWAIPTPNEEAPPAYKPFFLAHCLRDGKTINVTDGYQYLRWNTQTGSSLGGPFIDDEPVSGRGSINISPDGKLAAIGTSRGARVYDMTTGKRLRRLFGGDATGDVAFSPDGKMLATITRNTQALSVWDVSKGVLLNGGMGGVHRQHIPSIGFNPDGSLVASCSFDMSVCIWDVKKGTALHGRMEGHTSRVSCVDFSPDGRYLVSIDKEKIIIWNVQSGEKAHQISPPEDTEAMQEVAWSPDGQWVAVAGLDSIIRVLEISTGKLVVAPLRGHTAPINNMQFSDQGSLRLVSTAEDRTVRIWDVGPKMQGRMDSKGDNELWLNEDGWVYQGRSTEKILWVPPPLRKGLCLPPQIDVFGAPKVHVDLDNLVHGKDWAQCWLQRNRHDTEVSSSFSYIIISMVTHWARLVFSWLLFPVD